MCKNLKKALVVINAQNLKLRDEIERAKVTNAQLAEAAKKAAAGGGLGSTLCRIIGAGVGAGLGGMAGVAAGMAGAVAGEAAVELIGNDIVGKP
jgi:hypothetical protein